ncbi:MAG TPA: sigma-54 dependent transcriptional regulator [Acidobacteriaceae bacterium]|nr:sigma-54 dependent transcriptional regulator [Acidobacteriaceae bacterium]
MATANMAFDRSVLLASADASLRQRLRNSLSGLRWDVREAHGGAEAIAQLEGRPTEALLLDHWLPDLEVMELAEQIGTLYPSMELLRIDGNPMARGTRSPRRHELLHAVREALGTPHRDTCAPDPIPSTEDAVTAVRMRAVAEVRPGKSSVLSRPVSSTTPRGIEIPRTFSNPSASVAIEGLVGESDLMLDLARTIRLVAPHTATVLIEGETGTGKEVVAQAVHHLSPRSAKPFVVLNCAAIPEALLEAELFGHTRGAFTGAVQSRTGRIEAAHGGTLFLDEIGEMPLGLQAKMLRFLENGEIQRVGDNEVVRVNVRVIAATHQDLEARATAGDFRLDLYHRLAVFPMEIPPLRERLDDIAALSEHFLALMGRNSPRKSLSAGALDKLCTHDWPGNVRELAHVLERASILAVDSPTLRAEDIRLRRAPRG